MTTAQFDVYRQLKAEITSFGLRPGASLVEAELSERYGVSRTPVREALRQLEREGLVVALANRGRAVRDISLRDYEDISLARLALEDLAVQQACERASDEAIAALAEKWDVPEAGSADGSYVYTDESFHSGIARLSGNEFLIGELDRINDRIRIIRLTDFTHEDRIEVVRADHAAVLEAMRARDVDRARELMRDHIERSHANIRGIIARALERTYLETPSVGR